MADKSVNQPASSSSSTNQRHVSFVQFPSDNFVLAAGGVLFRHLPPQQVQSTTSSGQPDLTPPSTKGTLQICVLHNLKSDAWVLPKGRKDVNEPLESAALREVFEETGYACEFLPCPMLTRAPNPNLYIGLQPHMEPASTEPFTVTVRAQGDGSMKIIFWYLMRVPSNSTRRMEGTQMLNEQFDSHFVDAREAIQRLTVTENQKVAKLAVDLIENAMVTTDSRSLFKS